MPDVWSQPPTQRHETSEMENGTSSDSKIRSFFHSITVSFDDRWNSREANGQGERGQEEEQQENAPAPRLFFHVDAESVQEIPPPYRDRTRPITTPSAGSDEMTMVGSNIDTEEEQAGSAEVRIPPAQLQSFTAQFCQDSEVREVPAHLPTHSDLGTNGLVEWGREK